MIYALYAAMVALALSLSVLLAVRIGRSIGAKQRVTEGLAPLEGAVFGLMGLMLAFTFQGAAERLDVRRRLIVEEANAISTAYSRVDLLPAAAQPPIRDAFRRYVDARLATYRKLPDFESAKRELAKAGALQRRIWQLCLPASYQATSPAATMLVVNALNPMFDIANTRSAAAQFHPPLAIYLMLVVASLVSSMLAGYGMGARGAKSWLHLASFAALLAVTLYVILDLELPRLGLIRVDPFDQLLRDVRNSMK